MARQEDHTGGLSEALGKAIELHQSGALEEALAAYDHFIAKVPEGSVGSTSTTLGSVHSRLFTFLRMHLAARSRYREREVEAREPEYSA